MIHKSIIAAAALAASALVPASAIAATTFNFNTGGTNSDATPLNIYGNVRTFTGSDGTKVEASAYSRETTTSKSWSWNSGWTTVTTNTLTDSYLGQYTGGGANQYGLGVTNRGDSDNHTVDNSGWTDFIVLQFDKVVSVSQLGLYGFGGTDLTWAVATTNTPFNGALTFNNYDALTSTFTTFNSSTGADSTTYTTRSVNNGGLTGNLFLVAASSFDAAGSNDSFKLSSLKANVAAVPEPATWGMMMIGLGLAGAMMRRSKANTAVSFA